MNKVLFWLFFIVCLAAPPCQNAFASKSQSNSPLKQGKHLKHYRYGMFGTELSRQDHDRKSGKLVHKAYVDHFSASKKGKATFGGANDIKPPRTSRSASNSLLLKPNLFFSAALKHLAVGFFICFMLII